eukprot:12816252-Alexandrium_andersonii.AAC.1
MLDGPPVAAAQGQGGNRRGASEGALGHGGPKEATRKHRTRAGALSCNRRLWHSSAERPGLSTQH